MLRIVPSFSEPVPFFRPRRAGPECTMEDCVIQHLPSLFGSEHPNWMAGSVPVGAGLPDLIFATYQALVTGLAEAGAVDTNILAYLRVVGRARPETIATRLRLSQRVVEQRVRMLLEVRALTDSNGAVALTPACRDLLPKVTAIEVKVDNWCLPENPSIGAFLSRSTTLSAPVAAQFRPGRCQRSVWVG